MVQLSIQDVTQESKVRARISSWEVSFVSGAGGGEGCFGDEVSSEKPLMARAFWRNRNDTVVCIVF